MTRPLAIIGFGGHGRVVLAALRASGKRVVAATCLDPAAECKHASGLVLLTDEQLLSKYAADQIQLVLGMGGVAPEQPDGIRSRVVGRFRDLGYHFAGVCHPTAWIAPDVQLAATAQIHAGAVIQPGAVVGDFTIVNTKASVDHDCQLGNFCHLAPGVTLSGSVTVGNGVHVGTGAVVIQGLHLAERAFVGAGATVVKDIAAGIQVRGTPARPVG